MTPTLPAWARLTEREGKIPVVDVDAAGMYDDVLSDYRAFYAQGHPDVDDETVRELNAPHPTAYWLEVAYQSGKMDLQIAMRTPSFEIHVHDPDKTFAQRTATPGRDPNLAAGVLGLADGGQLRANEARAHYKRLRGFVPS
jgi:hypothetical protein